MNIINKLIPKHFSLNPSIQGSVSLIVALCLVIIFSSIILSGVFYWINFIKGVYILLYTMLAMSGYFMVLRITKNLDFIGGYFIVQSIIISLLLSTCTGGGISPFVMWLFGVIPVSFLYFKRRLATTWSIIALSSYVVLIVLQISGIKMEQFLPEKLYFGLWGFMFVFVALIFCSLFIGFQSGIKKASYRLKQSNDDLKNSNEELERFAYIASHDLKSPLKNIIGFVGLVKRRHLKQLDESGQEYFRIIENNARHMNNLIEDILEFSQVNDRGIRREAINLNKLFEEIKSNLEAIYPKAIISADSLPVIQSDYVRLHQVFQNLLENGLKYNKNKVKKVHIGFKSDHQNIQFAFQDNGIGIDEKYHTQIFEMFKRLHNQAAFEGTGIGLAVCKKIVHYLDGDIQLSSTPGIGSTFHISFPKTIQEEKLEIEPILDQV